MPGAIEFCRPRPDDPSLELQHYFCCFFVNCDSQHVLLCGNRETKVPADTSLGFIYTNPQVLRLSVGSSTRAILGK